MSKTHPGRRTLGEQPASAVRAVPAGPAPSLSARQCIRGSTTTRSVGLPTRSVQSAKSYLPVFRSAGEQLGELQHV